MSSPAPTASRHVSRKASQFTESVIREMTREAMKYGAVNLSQGYPDFPAPEDIKRVAMQAIADDVNQYAITWGAKDFRDAIATKTKWHLGFEIDPETEITVTCGSTEGMISAMMATVDPGDEGHVFEPFYENYAPDAILSDAKPRYVPLRAPDWSFDRDELRAAFNPKPKAIIVCNPNNPTGKVFTRDEMEFIAGLCQEFDALCFTDEIYEHILYPRAGAEIAHISEEHTSELQSQSNLVCRLLLEKKKVLDPADHDDYVRHLLAAVAASRHKCVIALMAALTATGGWRPHATKARFNILTPSTITSR